MMVWLTKLVSLLYVIPPELDCDVLTQWIQPAFLMLVQALDGDWYPITMLFTI